jgi:homocysteine S-methyltransferase
MNILEELETTILPGDGAMGTEIMEAGIPPGNCFEELCVSRPELVSGIHESYIQAGARLIRTNSFGANAARLAAFGFEKRVNEINWSAAQLAKQCARGKGVYVAGSVGPLALNAAQATERGTNREALFREQIGALLDGGVNLIFLETFTDPEELALAFYVKQSLHHCPVICSMACAPDGVLPGGDPLDTALGKLRDLGADLTGVNCVNGMNAALRLCTETPGIQSAFPNAGLPERRADGGFLYHTTPEEFAGAATSIARSGVRLIGGCCGIGPRHIAAMTSALKPAATGAAQQPVTQP